jgi:hypothetical protein
MIGTADPDGQPGQRREFIGRIERPDRRASPGDPRFGRRVGLIGTFDRTPARHRATPD